MCFPWNTLWLTNNRNTPGFSTLLDNIIIQISVALKTWRLRHVSGWWFSIMYVSQRSIHLTAVLTAVLWAFDSELWPMRPGRFGCSPTPIESILVNAQGGEWRADTTFILDSLCFAQCDRSNRSWPFKNWHRSFNQEKKKSKTNLL